MVSYTSRLLLKLSGWCARKYSKLALIWLFGSFNSCAKEFSISKKALYGNVCFASLTCVKFGVKSLFSSCEKSILPSSSLWLARGFFAPKLGFCALGFKFARGFALGFAPLAFKFARGFASKFAPLTFKFASPVRGFALKFTFKFVRGFASFNSPLNLPHLR